jgi:hypothetical protein
VFFTHPPRRRRKRRRQQRRVMAATPLGIQNDVTLEGMPRHGQGLKRRPPATAQAAEVRNKSRRPRPLRQRDALNQRRRRHNNDKRTLTKQALPWRHIDREFQEKTKTKLITKINRQCKIKAKLQSKSPGDIKDKCKVQGHQPPVVFTSTTAP